jgi:hypothetical protein
MKKKDTAREAPQEMIGREGDLIRSLECVADGECCSIVGVSNIGKSTFLRALSPGAARTQHRGLMGKGVIVYVDLNLALQTTEQGFYEATLRNLLAVLRNRSSNVKLVSAAQEAYQTVVDPANPFLLPLAFENCLEAVCGLQDAMLVLLFDEFDEAFENIDPHLFVRLRALRDKHGQRLCYVTATDQTLQEIRREREAGEFCELFEGHTYHLGPLLDSDARALAHKWALQFKAELKPEDTDFLAQRAGGHPGLLLTISRVLAKSRDEALLRPVAVGHARVQERLDSDPNVRLECAKLWSDLKTNEQEALISLLAGGDTSGSLESLTEKGLVSVTSAGVRVFAGQFEDFVRRQAKMRRREPRGVRIDVEAGDVWVDGRLAPVLTELEYKLLLLLYGNLGKICDKYKVVESVWGESYIDEVDDARIEKLVSRLRDKIEPNPQEPRYVITVRGRGYKLVSPE